NCTTSDPTDDSSGADSIPTLQPGPFDAAKTDRDFIGRLDTFVAVDPAGRNLVDIALAKPFDERDVTPDILGIGRLRGTKEAVLDEKVMKSGRTTRKTEGTVMDVSATLRVAYQAGSYVFTDQR